MDFEIQTAAQTAVNCPDGIPASIAAKTLCEIRGVDPSAFVNTPYGGMYCWQKVVFESLLLRVINGN